MPDEFRPLGLQLETPRIRTITSSFSIAALLVGSSCFFAGERPAPGTDSPISKDLTAISVACRRCAVMNSSEFPEDLQALVALDENGNSNGDSTPTGCQPASRAA
jgi:hypothetical protein